MLFPLFQWWMKSELPFVSPPKYRSPYLHPLKLCGCRYLSATCHCNLAWRSPNTIIIQPLGDSYHSHMKDLLFSNYICSFFLACLLNLLTFLQWLITVPLQVQLYVSLYPMQHKKSILYRQASSVELQKERQDCGPSVAEL